jgi:hypothetical protein
MLLIVLVLVFSYAHQCEDEVVRMQDQVPQHINDYFRLENRKKFTTSSLARSSISGFIRGALIGAIINGYDGAAVGGTVFAIINPILIGVEQIL